MTDTPLWDDRELPEFGSQAGNIHCKILIAGCGLCGLMTAYRLVNKGVDGNDIVLIDASRIFSGSSVRATAKLTSQHGIVYDPLIRNFGIERAQQYAAANENAIRLAFEISEQLGIPDAIESKTALLYATDNDQLTALHKEADAASRCGIVCKVGKTHELPFEVSGMIAYADQASIHPKRFAEGAVRHLQDKGCRIYENVTALSVQGDAVLTDKGKIFTEKTVISTRFPFVDKRGLYFIKLHQQRSYLLALKGAPRLKGMYLGIGDDGYTFRQAGELLIFGGGVCRNGMGGYSHFFDLTGKAAEYFEGCEIVNRWSNEDTVTNDGVPYIGANKFLPNTYIATGFGMWGMSSSFAAAEIISSQIVHGYAENSDIFSPARSMLRAGKKSFVINTAEVAAEFASITRAVDGHHGKGVTVSVDENGRSHLHVPLCTHMKCPLRWNREEHCWDCPCHGSRFDTDGNVLSGPAMKKIKFKGVFDREIINKL